MNEMEKMYFENLKKESQQKPFLKVEEASKAIAEMLRKSCLSKDGIVQVDLWVYFAASLTGICCAKMAALNANRLIVENASVSNYVAMMKLDTEIGSFYVGDAIDEYLFHGDFSACRMVGVLYSEFYKHGNMPDVNALEKKCISNLGKKEYRLWDNLHNAYEEKISAAQVYESIDTYLKPFELSDHEKVMSYAMALASVIVKAEGVFPARLNCMEMSMETVIFYAHMDYSMQFK